MELFLYARSFLSYCQNQFASNVQTVCSAYAQSPTLHPSGGHQHSLQKNPSKQFLIWKKKNIYFAIISQNAYMICNFLPIICIQFEWHKRIFSIIDPQLGWISLFAGRYCKFFRNLYQKCLSGIIYYHIYTFTFIAQNA